jgi:hypothetical protein
MKCIKKVKGTEVTRVTNEEAKQRVKSGLWHYTSKGEWKSTGRRRG